MERARFKEGPSKSGPQRVFLKGRDSTRRGGLPPEASEKQWVGSGNVGQWGGRASTWSASTFSERLVISA